MGRGRPTPDETIERIKATYAMNGNARETSRALNVPVATVHKYIDPESKNEFEQVRTEKLSEVIPNVIAKIEQVEMVLLDAIIKRAKTGEDTARDLATAFGILRDKHLLITGQPNSRVHNTTDASATLTPEEMEQAAIIRERFASAELVTR
jgi:hypothetical protein